VKSKLTPKGRSKSNAVRPSQTATLETEFCGQRLRPRAPPMSRRDGGKDLADRRLPPQASEMSCYSADQEITSICADFLVELRGFEPMAIAGAGSY
jgi:hypothetical protein